MSADEEKSEVWRRVVDQKSGREYFYNVSTRETRWSLPEGVKLLPAKTDRLVAARAHAVQRRSMESGSRSSALKRQSIALAASRAANETAPVASDEAATEDTAPASPHESDFEAEDVAAAEAEEEDGKAGSAGAEAGERPKLPPWSVISGNVPPVSPQFLFREEDYEISTDPVSGARTFRRKAPAAEPQPGLEEQAAGPGLRTMRGVRMVGWLRGAGKAKAGGASDARIGGAGGGAANAEEEEEEEAGPDAAVSWATLSGNRPVISMQYHRQQGATMMWGMHSSGGGLAAKSRRPSLTPAESIREARREPPDLTKLRVLVGTWNVGNKMPSEDLSEWVPAGGGGHDIIVVGAQECSYKVKESEPGGERDEDEDEDEEDEEAESEQAAVHFYRRIQRHVGRDYVAIRERQLLQMRLLVLARRELEHAIGHIEGTEIPTGLGHVVGNKGGLIIRFTVYTASLAFVSCHLAAHEGERFLESRNASCRAILSGARLGRAVNPLAFTHHVFWFGDLNYRCDLNAGASKEQRMEHEQHWAAVRARIASGDQAGLLAADELRRQIEAGDALTGFREGEITFDPTFKVERRPGMHWLMQRVPSFTDRVLWHSLPRFGPLLKQVRYWSAPSVSSSDHKPVAASFELRVPSMPNLPSHPRADGRILSVVMHSAQASNLRAADRNGLSDPYLIFGSEPPLMFALRDKDLPRSTIQPKTLNPSWNAASLPVLHARCCTRAELAQTHLVVRVLDHDQGSWNADDDLGVAIIGLRDVCGSHRPTSVTVPVVWNSLHCGDLTLEVSIMERGERAPEIDSDGEAAQEQELGISTSLSPLFVRGKGAESVWVKREHPRTGQSFWYNPLTDTSMWRPRREGEAGRTGDAAEDGEDEEDDEEAFEKDFMDPEVARRTVQSASLLNEEALDIARRHGLSESELSAVRDIRNGGPVGGVYASLPSVIISGLLQKQSTKLTLVGRRRWQERFAVLRGNLLCYYKTRDQFDEGRPPQRDAMVDMRTYALLAHPVAGLYSFSLVDAVGKRGKTYVFMSEDATTCDAWLDALSQVTRRQVSGAVA